MPNRIHFVGVCVVIKNTGERAQFVLNRVGPHHFKIGAAEKDQMSYFQGSYHVTALDKQYPNEELQEALLRIMRQQIGFQFGMPFPSKPVYEGCDDERQYSFYKFLLSGYKEYIQFRANVNSGGFHLLDADDLPFVEKLLHKHRSGVPGNTLFMKEIEREALFAVEKSMIVSF